MCALKSFTFLSSWQFVINFPLKLSLLYFIERMFFQRPSANVYGKESLCPHKVHGAFLVTYETSFLFFSSSSIKMTSR